MIFGEYPCCNGPLSTSIPPGARLPLFRREDCPHCGADVWHKLSRWAPTSWLAADFHKEFEIGKDGKVRPKVSAETANGRST